MRIRLYRNLSPQYRQQQAWSIMAMEGPKKGKVVDVVDGAVIRDARFLVSEAGRQRVVRDRVRNVHAFVEGQLAKTFALDSLRKDVDGEGLMPGSGVTVRISYDPYHPRGLMFREDCMETVSSSVLVVAAPRGVYAKLDPCRTQRRGGTKIIDDLNGLDGFHAYNVDNWNG